MPVSPLVVAILFSTRGGATLAAAADDDQKTAGAV